MTDLFNSGENLKKSIIALLLEFLKVAQHLGMDEEAVKEIEQQRHLYKLEVPSTEKERMTILYYLLFLMDIDGEVSKEEEQLVEDFGFRLGFSTNLTSEMISVIKDHTNSKVPPEELIDKIRKYLN
jgi:hypothetical protein